VDVFGKSTGPSVGIGVPVTVEVGFGLEGLVVGLVVEVVGFDVEEVGLADEPDVGVGEGVGVGKAPALNIILSIYN
jgi:hypothetical protein